MRAICCFAIATLLATTTHVFSESKLDCALPEVKRLVIITHFTHVMKEVSLLHSNPFVVLLLKNNEEFRSLFREDYLVDMDDSLNVPADQIEGITERECQVDAKSDYENKFCTLVRSYKLGFVRTTDVHPRTGNLECAASLIDSDEKDRGTVSYKVDATADGLFVTVDVN